MRGFQQLPNAVCTKKPAARSPKGFGGCGVSPSGWIGSWSWPKEWEGEEGELREDSEEGKEEWERDREDLEEESEA